MSKPTVKFIIEALGVEVICAKLQVSHHAVRYAKTEGVFPAAWYAGLLELCSAAEIECPLEAFSWKGQPPTTEDAA
jgi:hypothetical protein